MRLMGYVITLSMMIFVFSMFLDLVILGGRYSTVFVEENLLVIYVELFLSFFAIVFIAKKAYEESLVFWEKRFRIR